MLYYFLYQMLFREYGAGSSDSYLFKGLNVFQYVTFRTAWATITALLITLFFGKGVIRKLAELKFGQEIREEGPASHQEKRGTPTMGGILIIGSVFISTVLWARLDNLFLGSLSVRRCSSLPLALRTITRRSSRSEVSGLRENRSSRDNS
jgi:phospho-N-acetylmuramoyl-pentapeptide-transferase